VRAGRFCDAVANSSAVSGSISPVQIRYNTVAGLRFNVIPRNAAARQTSCNRTSLASDISVL